jgi:hypothetical protein
MCTHPIDPKGIHLLHCAHGNKYTGTHDVVHNTFAIIEQDVGFHMGWKQLHALPSNASNSPHYQIDIMFIKDGIRTLVNIVFLDPTRVDLLPRSCASQGFDASNVVQAKKRSYRD